METIPWYRAAIVRQQVVQLLIAVTAFFGITSADIDWDATVGAIFAGWSAGVAVWTIITRFIKPAPNLTVTAALKEQEMIRTGKIPLASMATDTRRQRGRALPLQLLFLSALGFVVLMLSGCPGTATTYKQQETLPDLAYVIAEHYFAVVKQAADVAENSATPADMKESLKSVGRRTAPFIIGDEATKRPGLRDLAETFNAVRDAKSEADLQAAINEAVRELTNFSNAVKAARSRTDVTGYIPANAGPDRAARRCARFGIARTETFRRCAVLVG